MKKTVLLSVVSLALSGQAMAAAYKIPEQSINSTALSAAYVANAHGADAAYYNPAAMMFNENRSLLEVDLTYIHLTSIDFNGTSGPLSPPFPSGNASDSSEKENFLVPTLHYTSPLWNNMRFGLSMVTPAGLSKRWKGNAEYAAEEFTLKTVEINPSIAYKLTDNLAVAGGVRVVYSKGKVRSSGPIPGVPTGTLTMSRDMKGDSFDYGYNLALLFKPTDELSLAATYRSKIKLTEEGDATLTSSGLLGAGGAYSGSASVWVPLPAALNLAAAYTFAQATTVELTYERTYWSAYKELDFNYGSALPNAVLTAAYDNPSPRDWKDSDTFRLGITHRLNSKWILMAGFAVDETPVPKKTLNFELPDSDAKIYSIGARYQYSDKLSIGGTVLYDDKEKLEMTASDNNDNGIVGDFKGAGAYLFTFGMEYKF